VEILMMRSRASVRRMAFLCFLLLAGAKTAQGAAVDSLEYAIKATFLYKFSPFVEWPATAFASSSAPISLCVFGNDPVTTLIDRVTAEQRVGNRPIMVRHLQGVARDAGCHILYVAESNEQRATQALNAVRGTPVLTITDSVRSGRDAGIVTFVLVENRVRFDIDLAAATENGLSISSRLLSLARSVRPAR
jgi:uncharacterized protein DUF4154